MNIIVCVKQVPANTQVKLNPVTNTLIRDGVQNTINHFDLNALEAALELRERYGGKVTVITMGPPQAEEVLKRAITMKIDAAYLVCGREFAGADTLATSYTLAKAIQKIGVPDIIICGKQAIDGDTAQVGSGIAEWLKIALVSNISKIESIEDGKIVVHRHMDSGSEVVRAQLPVLLTASKELNQPRVGSVTGRLAAKTFKPEVLSAADLDCDLDMLGLKGSPTTVSKVFVPQREKQKELLEGDIETQATTLVNKLKKAQLVV